MMVNCPKCGFSQPQDQYCAQCGIDMLAFKPVEKPLLQRVLGNTLFQTIALVVLVATVLIFVRHQRHKEIAERVAEIENAKNTEIVNRKTAEAPKNELAQASTTPPPETAPEPAATPSMDATSTASGSSVAAAQGAAAAVVGAAAANAPGAAPSAAATPSTDAAGGAGTVGKPASNLRVVFVEVPRSLVPELVASSDTRFPVSSSGPTYFGVIPNLQAKLRASQGSGRMKIVDSNSRSIEAGQAASLNSGQRDEASGQLLGFDVEVVATQLTDSESHLQIRVLRYLKDPNGQPEEFSIPLPDSLTIPKGAGAFISGVLPRRISEQDRRFYDPFKTLHILSTEDYRAGTTDLVILIEPR